MPIEVSVRIGAREGEDVDGEWSGGLGHFESHGSNVGRAPSSDTELLSGARGHTFSFLVALVAAWCSSTLVSSAVNEDIHSPLVQELF